MKSRSDTAVSMRKQRKRLLESMFRPIVDLKTRNIFFYGVKTEFVVIHITREKQLFMIRIVLAKLDNLIDIISVYGLFIDVDQNIGTCTLGHGSRSLSLIPFSLSLKYNLLCEIFVQHRFLVEFFGDQ